MADPTTAKLRGLVLSAYEVKTLTGWPDAMVEDYLNILRSLLELAGSIDETAEAAIGVESKNTARLLALQAQVGSGNFLTSDETGFTVDTDKLSVDMDEA